MKILPSAKLILLRNIIRIGQVIALMLWLSAGIQRPLSIKELTGLADVIASGKVISKTCKRDSLHQIITEVALEPTECWKGGISDRPLVILQAGGTLGDRITKVSGQAEYKVGEDVVVFLSKNQLGSLVTIGLDQGKFEIWKHGETGKICVRNKFHSGIPLSSSTAMSLREPGVIPVSRGFNPLPLADLKQAVLECIR